MFTRARYQEIGHVPIVHTKATNAIMALELDTQVMNANNGYPQPPNGDLVTAQTTTVHPEYAGSCYSKQLSGST